VNLYLVRHGDALARGEGAATDAGRPLSPQGEDEARAAGRLLSAVDPAITLVLTSPAVRAVETGRLLAGAFSVRPELKTSDRLRPGATAEAILQETVASRRESMVIVGHQPDLGTAIAWLVADGTPASIAIPPGAVACVEMERDTQFPRASLRWLAPPRLIRQLTGE
jgi:phosphohistidine phosphatase